MEPRLKPVEKPSSLIMKIAYYLTKKQYGKVLTPLKVIYARLPLRFSLFTQKIGQISEKLTLNMELSLLIRTYVAQLNTCLFCIDIGKAIAIKKQKHSEKFQHLYEYQDSPVFSTAEKAALSLAYELTKNKSISDTTFNTAREYFSERQVIEIVWCIATEHYYNFMNVAFELHADNLCDLDMKEKIRRKASHLQHHE